MSNGLFFIYNGESSVILVILKKKNYFKIKLKMEYKRKFHFSSSGNTSSEDKLKKSKITKTIASADRKNNPWAILVPVDEFTKEVGAIYLSNSYNIFGNNPTCDGVSVN